MTVPVQPPVKREPRPSRLAPFVNPKRATIGACLIGHCA